VANEITISASLNYDDSAGSNVTLTTANLILSAGTKQYTMLSMNVTVAAQAVPLGNLSTPGFALFVNRDQTNYISLSNVNGGGELARVPAATGGTSPGIALLQLGSSFNAPWARSNTANCKMEILIASQ
jgi:hypothetical protein